MIIDDDDYDKTLQIIFIYGFLQMWFPKKRYSDPEDLPEFHEEICHNMLEYDDEQSLEQDEMSETECDRDCNGVTRQRKSAADSVSPFTISRSLQYSAEFTNSQ
ncbi:hypothetical protein CDAR_466311 [Caerostris darwini]|uniref:Uncharacterized protein n=1 Tax=Caerostris darwini TaxID=1538125 RepID=A0AAV4WQQ1_9ARAC|nr:hypothetical protein CDAR_466311 [Caerostris darwini]